MVFLLVVIVERKKMNFILYIKKVNCLGKKSINIYSRTEYIFYDIYRLTLFIITFMCIDESIISFSVWFVFEKIFLIFR